MRTRVGYTGGTTPDPTYETIGDHSEALEIEYDPARIGYAELLRVFWEAHGQRPRAGSRQYRAAVFALDAEQRRLALASRDQQALAWKAAASTEVLPAGVFTPAEDYHQKYYLRGNQLLAAELRARHPDEAAFIASTAAARVNGYLGGHGTPEQFASEIDAFGLSAPARRLLQALVARNRPSAVCPVGGASRGE